jgi:hypothetical protein
LHALKIELDTIVAPPVRHYVVVRAVDFFFLCVWTSSVI